jgi:hypothetical protein
MAFNLRQFGLEDKEIRGPLENTWHKMAGYAIV